MLINSSCDQNLKALYYLVFIYFNFLIIAVKSLLAQKLQTSNILQYIGHKCVSIEKVKFYPFGH